MAEWFVSHETSLLWEEIASSEKSESEQICALQCRTGLNLVLFSNTDTVCMVWVRDIHTSAFKEGQIFCSIT